MKYIISFILAVGSLSVVAQDYAYWSHQADSLLKAKEFKRAATAYSNAFKANGWKGKLEDRFNSGAAWAMCSMNDSAFHQLFRIAEKGKYEDQEKLETTNYFQSLHKDKRWKKLIELVRQNKVDVQSHLIQPAANELKMIHREDQKYRMMSDSIEKKFGWNSVEMQKIWHTIHKTDSLNQLKVAAILDKYGWLSAEEATTEGSGALFLVVQHAELPMQEKYLPMMREAVKNGKASGGNLALLEDRVAMRQGRKQIYGSQVRRDNGGPYYVYDIEDPAGVDKRRAEVGLGPLADYLSIWNIKWDPVDHLNNQKKK